MKKIKWISRIMQLSFLVFLSSCATESKPADDIVIDDIDWVYESLAKARIHLENAKAEVINTKLLPRSTERGFRPIRDWTSGFYPGCLWLMYEYTKDESLKISAEKTTAFLEKEKYNTEDHDIGFRIYCSYGNANRIEGKKEYQDVIVEAAKSLSTRYNDNIGAIQSWHSRESRDWLFPVIVDNMMNLELMFTATKFSKDSSFYKKAYDHAVTTLNNHYRDDNSCAHVVDYDPKTGAFRKMDYNNGYENPKSAWSRGQAWGLYGFTMTFRETGDIRFLERAEKSAAFILDNPNLPDDKIPYWDFRSKEIPTVRDASAAAIAASGLLELSQYSTENGDKYFNAAESILKTLSSPEYFAEPGTNSNFIIKHTTGNYRLKSEVDGSLIYADYYYLEGLLRYLELNEV